MKCPGCGVDVVSKAVFCHHCGARLDVEQGFDPDELDGAEKSYNMPIERNVPASEPKDEHAAASDERTESIEQHSDYTTQGTERTQSNAEKIRDAMGQNSDRVETDLWEGGYCVKAMTGSWVLGGVLSVCIVGLGIFFSIKEWAPSFVWWGVLIALIALWGYLVVLLLRRRLGVHYRLSTQRFFHEEGIFRHKTDLIEVIDMDDIAFEQNIIDRMVGVGSICIVSSDRSHPELTIHGIENVKDVAAKMRDARHEERMRRGLHIEQV